MSAQNSAGIQTLLDVCVRFPELERAAVVSDWGTDVKRDRLRGKHRRLFRELENRVKEARDEAKKEIDAYKKSKDDEFKKFESEHTSGNKKAEEDANKDAEKKIKEIQTAGKKGQDAVVKDLLKAVFDVKPVVPKRIDAPA
ncbi:related to VACUOLAR ATP SYNTHASE SUBUNIT G (VMA-10) [Rhynchosporium agropyri]|uniref:V-type proton ATPase subunit G n=1 Tax=Rhynchosporium agropyri TaxID=914238 RepID=A0A1E1KXE5_9HELO|nr:related to VACUOLAR ATP SYNTHASE SUBUNIT G (VMA-10) [Rhynchosporium agropyri]